MRCVIGRYATCVACSVMSVACAAAPVTDQSVVSPRFFDYTWCEVAGSVPVRIHRGDASGRGTVSAAEACELLRLALAGVAAMPPGKTVEPADTAQIEGALVGAVTSRTLAKTASGDLETVHVERGWSLGLYLRDRPYDAHVYISEVDRLPRVWAADTKAGQRPPWPEAGKRP